MSPTKKERTMSKWKDMLRMGRGVNEENHAEESLDKTVLQEEQLEDMDHAIALLADEDGSREHRLQMEAAKEAKSAAESTVKKLHFIQMGRCPACGEHLRQFLFASICEACGWHMFDTPRAGPIRVHLKDGSGVVEGDRCYIISTGFALVLRDEVVIAKVPKEAYTHVEYTWSDEEVEQRRKYVLERLQISCGWCGKPTDPNADGFHLVHVAFGATQERYCFCSDDCFEAFRRMYPARVHRDCYNRNCGECNLCIKRYGDEAEGIRNLAKDYLAVPRAQAERRGREGAE
jgi:hypothetical protein